MLVTGGAGLLGGRLLAGAPPGWTARGTRHRRPVRHAESFPVDLADAGAVDALVARLRPDLVVHTAYRKRDGQRDIVAATRNVAASAGRHGAGLLHISSDVVFDGEHAPYAEAAPPAPVDQYGRWKAEAERWVRDAVPDAAIVRTSLIISSDPLDPTSTWLAGRLRGDDEPGLYADELRCPVHVDDLVGQLWELIGLARDRRAGPWHLVGPEAVSRHTLGVLLAARLGLPPPARASLNREHPGPRPRDLRLLTARADTALRARPRPIGAALAEVGP